MVCFSPARRAGYFSTCIVSVFIAAMALGCSTDIDIDDIAFACESDADCTGDYRCLDGPGESMTCQLPGGEPGRDVDVDSDSGPDSQPDTDADTSSDSDVDPDAGAGCEAGTEEVCDCDELPEGIDGDRLCSEDEVRGSCRCPEVCNDPGVGVVIAGSPCGICEAGEYVCSDGAAECDEPGSVNSCGGCEPHPPASACGSDQELICRSDETATCVDVEDVTLILNASDELADVNDVFYAYVDDVDEIAGCPENWEIGAWSRPVVYSRATASGDSSFVIELPTSIDSPGVLRVVIEQELELHGQDAPQSVATHFGCTAVESPGTDITVTPYLHPNLLRGDYRLSYNMSSGSISAQDFWGFMSNDWTFPAMYSFFSSPGILFVGCHGEECPQGNVDSLFLHYDNAQADPQFPTLTFWGDFYDTFTTFIDEMPESGDLLRQAYQSLFDDHMDEVNTHFPEHYSLVQRNYDDGRFLPLENHSPRGRTALSFPTQKYGSTFVEGFVNSVSLAISQDSFYGPCIGGGTCYDFVDFVEAESAVASVPALVVDDSMEKATFDEITVKPPAEELFGYLFYDYLPAQIFPRIVEVEIGPDQIERVLSGWDSFSDLFREIAPCDDVVQVLIDDGVDSSVATEFEDICNDLYGDPDGLEVLRRLQEIAPKTIDFNFQINLNIDGENMNDGSCFADFEADPIQGLRLRSLYSDFSGACTAPQPTLHIGGQFIPTQELLNPFRISLDTD